jgi:hypothetical protein
MLLAGKSWVCLGETDEWHPFCPFATASKERADEHSKIPGHWCVDDVVPEGMWADSLEQEAAQCR